MLAPEKQDQRPLGRLVGFVLDASGAPLEDVGVVLRPGSQPPGDTTTQHWAWTDKTGAFSIDSVGRRSYILFVMDVGWESQWREYQGARGITDTLCIEMRRPPIYLDPVYINKPPMKSQ